MREYYSEMTEARKVNENIYERKEKAVSEVKIIEEDNEDWKFIEITPPPKKEIALSCLPNYKEQGRFTTSQAVTTAGSHHQKAQGTSFFGFLRGF